MSNSDEIKELQSLLNEILNVDRPEIYKNKIFQETSFENYGKEQFEKSFKLLKRVSGLDFDLIDGSAISQIKRFVNEYKSLCNNAKSLDADDAGGDPAQRRSQLVENARQINQNFLNTVHPFIDYRRETDMGFQKYEEEAKQAAASLQSKIDELTEQLEEKSKKSDAILSAMETASGKAGVSANSKHYEKACKEHADKAKSWFWYGFWLLVGLAVFVALAACLFLYSKKDAPFTLSYYEIATALVIAALVYAISFCNRNFQAEKHNEIINANKTRSLTTFASFVEAAGDEAVRDQVLLQACAAIFSNPATGFSKDQGLPLPPTAEAAKQVVRSVKGI